jgi:hypothetical protein
MSADPHDEAIVRGWATTEVELSNDVVIALAYRGDETDEPFPVIALAYQGEEGEENEHVVMEIETNEVVESAVV